MLGVLIPAHNEEQLLAGCLESVLAAARHPQLQGEKVMVAVVLDRCRDRSAAIARQYPVARLEADVGNVGKARAIGAQYLIDLGARWLASTDADSEVAENWLAAQLALQADMVCGTVQVAQWEDIPESVQRQYHAGYQYADGHRHIHGANLGFSREIYLRSGGFSAATAHEDVNFVRTCERLGARIAWSALPKVTTSARLVSRVQGGFADFLRNIHDSHRTL